MCRRKQRAHDPAETLADVRKIRIDVVTDRRSPLALFQAARERGEIRQRLQEMIARADHVLHFEERHPRSLWKSDQWPTGQVVAVARIVDALAVGRACRSPLTRRGTNRITRLIERIDQTLGTIPRAMCPIAVERKVDADRRQP